MSKNLVVEPLALHPEVLPELRIWLEREWPAWYGAGGQGRADEDLRAFSALAGLPFGVVALRDGHVCGVAALKAASIPSHEHLCPWASAGLVEPSLRRQGIGSLLLEALERRAQHEGFRSIHCATATAEDLLLRRGWSLLERVTHEERVSASIEVRSRRFVEITGYATRRRFHPVEGSPEPRRRLAVLSPGAVRKATLGSLRAFRGSRLHRAQA